MSARLAVRIAGKHAGARDVCVLELESLDGEPLPAYAPGAHVDVHVGNGISRQYSLCRYGGPAARYQIAVLREPASRGGSQAVHDGLDVGDVIEIGAPRNLFALADADGPSLLLAGGIGITPILCMAESLAARGGRFALHYCGRSRERMAFLDRLQAPGLAARAHIHTDDGPPAQRLDIAQVLARQEPGAHLYVCGPGGFIEAVIAQAREQGWDDARIHYERFSNPPGSDAAVAGDEGFEVQLSSSGEVFAVGKDESVVQALARHGVFVETSCEQGICGTCLLRVLDGEPDHRDMYLSDDEKRRNDQFLPCCSRARSKRLVLGL
ncbi:2Fe-2S iron-sulfur cluster-binding domain protein [Bordetella bronchiseptica GA96-01]|uniref:PDR/VanB family oxidoreductase n=1 Tax=Bordetella bronchiseptica TaxID=518 RepID=UPI00045B24D1|nr:PDR/VanB family oxidoreductase [Bordetella bronchiseptica]AZW33122.1 oxidoreductase [Bordetella bronchiseptica]KCV43712.1 2Fe-2S iron-sulfur cluster-binding domain protein [Bordetella bronchiseptica 345]KDC39660.1 2Fe-2S iron-sulfur cluster-binding domain protein [Bordetella bronchiseptica GA96-01]